MNKKVRSLLTIAGYMILFAGACSMLIPFLWMLYSALAPREALFSWPPAVLRTNYTIEHFRRAVQRGGFFLYFRNSVFVSSATVVLTLVITSMAGYSFSRLKWRLRDTLFIVVLGVTMLPGVVGLIPTFLVVMRTPLAGGNDILGQGGTGWLDTYPGLIFPAIGGGFNVFLLRQFFVSLPNELEDSGRVDGASEFQIFYRIMLPLCRPVLAVVALFTFQWSWNSFLWPLVITQSDNMRTIQLGLTLFRTQHESNWGQLMAATTLATVPTVALFLAFQGAFVQGIAVSGIKGAA